MSTEQQQIAPSGSSAFFSTSSSITSNPDTFTASQIELFNLLENIKNIDDLKKLPITYFDLLVRNKKQYSLLTLAAEISDPKLRQEVLNYFYSIIDANKEILFSNDSTLKTPWTNLAEAAVACHQGLDFIKSLNTNPHQQYISTAIEANNFHYLQNIEYSQSFGLNECNSDEVSHLDFIHQYNRIDIFKFLYTKETWSKESLLLRVIPLGNMTLFNLLLPDFIAATKNGSIGTSSIMSYTDFLRTFCDCTKHNQKEMMKTLLKNTSDLDFNYALKYFQGNEKLNGYNPSHIYQNLIPILIEEKRDYAFARCCEKSLIELSKTNLQEFETLLIKLKSNPTALTYYIQCYSPGDDNMPIDIETIAFNLIKIANSSEHIKYRDKIYSLLAEFVKLILNKPSKIGETKFTDIFTGEIYFDEIDEENKFRTAEILHHVIKTKNVELVQLMTELTGRTGYLNYFMADKKDGITLMCRAVEIGNWHIVKCLLEHGASPIEESKMPRRMDEVRDETARITPLQLAREKKHLPIHVLLKEAIEKRNAPAPNPQNNNNQNNNDDVSRPEYGRVIGCAFQ